MGEVVQRFGWLFLFDGIVDKFGDPVKPPFRFFLICPNIAVVIVIICSNNKNRLRALNPFLHRTLFSRLVG
jgi:hypothetical protein